MLEGHFYHIYNRGINKAPLFFERRNYIFFLKQFDKYLSDFVEVYSYCIMPNHFHFLVKIVKGNGPIDIANKLTDTKLLSPIEKAYRDFFISYSKSINKAYNRTGALFQFKYKRKPIFNENYLIRLIAYIHLNPVRAGLCKNADLWEFSSYNSIISDKSTKINRLEILNWFGDITNFIEFHNTYKDYQKERDFLFKDSIRFFK